MKQKVPPPTSTFPYFPAYISFSTSTDVPPLQFHDASGVVQIDLCYLSYERLPLESTAEEERVGNMAAAEVPSLVDVLSTDLVLME